MKKLVPESSRHVFAPIDPTWVKRVDYLQPAGEEAFTVVPRPAPNRKQRLFSHVAYFLSGRETEPSAYLKLMCYDAEGHLMQEVDQTQNERFERETYPDGSEAGYLHWQKSKGIVAGYNLDLHGKTIARVQNGEGEHLSWNFGPEDYTRGWLHHGAYYLTKIYRQRKLSSQTFWLLSGDNLRLTLREERLTVSAQQEFWTRRAQGIPYGQAWPADAREVNTGNLLKQHGPSEPFDAIHQRLLANKDFVRNPRPEDVARAMAQAKQDYQTRRNTFVRRYRTFLDEAHLKEMIPEITHSASLFNAEPS